VTVEVGDLVSLLRHGSPTVLGVVYSVYNPDNDGLGPRAKIFMKNGGLYEYLVEDLTIHTKGNNNDTV